MGAFSVVLDANSGGLHQTQAKIDGCLSDQGFRRFRQLKGTGYCVTLYPKLNGTPCGFYEHAGEDGFCVIVGTLIYDGIVGEAAARRLYFNFDGTSIPYDGAIGSYCVIIRKFGDLFLWIDQLGLYKTYAMESRGLWSSSFLASISDGSEHHLDQQSIYEYVFQGATYGSKTLVKRLSLAQPATLYRLIEPYSQETSQHWLLNSVDDVGDVFAACIKSSRNIFKSIAESQFDTIDSAVSGGYDSRLMLAFLLELDMKPRLHVYGSDESADVQNAKTIGERLNLVIDHVDKSQVGDVSTDAFSEIVHRNFMAFDGLPTDGIFDNGADLWSRQQRAIDGGLMLNGGGGEIFRNFFYLRDRRYSVKEILWSFYSQHSPRYCTALFDRNEYLEKLGNKIKNSLRIDEDDLRRGQVEMIYSLFRLRFWMGRNNSMNNRFGSVATPFSEPNVVRAALDIPIREKNSGRFEARMINDVCPSLAACPSNYGHDFAGDPPMRRKARDYLTYARPPRLRQYSYRLKQLFLPPITNEFLSKKYIEACIPGGLRIMDEYFILSRIRDPAVYARVATIEYLCSKGFVSQIH